MTGAEQDKLKDRIDVVSVLFEAIVTQELLLQNANEETIALSEKISTLMFKLKQSIV